MIDERKLLEKINDYCSEFDESLEENKSFDGYNIKSICMSVIAEILDLIQDQPKVGEWIPCSERLPEDNQAVLTCKNKHISILIWKSERRIWLETKGNWWWSYCMVEKWQPLPEPYEVKDND